MTMTVETPAHGQWRGLLHEWHAIDCTMAGGAPDTLCNMDAVIEIDVVRKDVHPLPVDGDVGGEALADRCKHFCVGPKLRMACHARFGGWKAGETRRCGRRMAIAAI